MFNTDSLGMRLLFWIVLCAGIWFGLQFLVGCDSATSEPSGIDAGVSVRGSAPDLGRDASAVSADTIVQAATPDAQIAIPDTFPTTCPNATVQQVPGSSLYHAQVVANTTGAFCFRTCDIANGIGWDRFLGRHITVNGEALGLPDVELQASDGLQGANGGGHPNIGFGSATRVSPYLVTVNAGAYADAMVTWSGTPVPCP